MKPSYTTLYPSQVTILQGKIRALKKFLIPWVGQGIKMDFMGYFVRFLSSLAFFGQRASSKYRNFLFLWKHYT